MCRLRAVQLESPDGSGLAFAFIEGSLVRAVREGHWLLLDEVHLAPLQSRTPPPPYLHRTGPASAPVT